MKKINHIKIFLIFSSIFFLSHFFSITAIEAGRNQAFAQSESDEVDGSSDVSDKNKEIERIEERQEDTKDAIKKKEAEIEDVKKQAEQVLEEKKVIEQEANIKEQAATVVQEELEAVTKEAAVTNDPKAIRKAEELQLKAGQLQKEAEVAQEKLSVAEKKATLAETTISNNQEQIESLKKAFESLRLEKASKRTLTEKLTRSGIIIAIFLFILFIGNRMIKGLVKLLTPKNVIRENAKTLRIKTLLILVDWLFDILVVCFMLYLLLDTFGINMAPLIAGAGIVGLALGFGGQYLIRDLINGLFILMEGQYRVNDVVKINDYGGLVEDINLRITSLRDLEGRVIIIPNGEIKTVVNFTKGYSQALFDIGVAYKENVDRVIDTIKTLGKEIREDDYFGKLILDDLEMFGVDSFGDSSVNIKFRIKTLPIKQWEVAREFRRRLKNRFDELNIEIPFPHRTVYWGSGEDNTWMKELVNHFGEKQKKTKNSADQK